MKAAIPKFAEESRSKDSEAIESLPTAPFGIRNARARLVNQSEPCTGLISEAGGNGNGMEIFARKGNEIQSARRNIQLEPGVTKVRQRLRGRRYPQGPGNRAKMHGPDFRGSSFAKKSPRLAHLVLRFILCPASYAKDQICRIKSPQNSAKDEKYKGRNADRKARG